VCLFYLTKLNSRRINSQIVTFSAERKIMERCEMGFANQNLNCLHQHKTKDMIKNRNIRVYIVEKITQQTNTDLKLKYY